MTVPIWLSKTLVLALHEQLITEFGGDDGLRDEGLLESALGKPENLIVYEPSSNVVRLAAAYAFGIVRNHPFLDGNKRTAFTAAVTFLERNGFELTASEIDATVATLALASGELSEENYANWLEGHCERAAPGEEARKLRQRKS